MIRLANGKLKISKKEWEDLGKKAGWIDNSEETGKTREETAKAGWEFLHRDVMDIKDTRNRNTPRQYIPGAGDMIKEIAKRIGKSENTIRSYLSKRNELYEILASEDMDFETKIQQASSLIMKRAFKGKGHPDRNEISKSVAETLGLKYRTIYNGFNSNQVLRRILFNDDLSKDGKIKRIINHLRSSKK